MAADQPHPTVSFQTHPDRYKHLMLSVDGPIARISLNVLEEGGLRPDDYTLKLNSYDVGVDIELADAVQRLRFEHPEVACVILTSAISGVFCSGANIFMLGTSAHAFKVNFCKYTNETRLYIEDASENSGQRYIAALNGVASGGGYELPLACEEIYLVDDRRSAVALPEVPFLGVLPGTGGLTRVVDKRKVRRDRADIFSTLAEGIKGKRAVKWNLVDGVYPLSKFDDAIQARASEIAGDGHTGNVGITLPNITADVDEDGNRTYEHVTLTFGPEPRVATLTVKAPTSVPDLPANPADLGDTWWALKAFRELDDALLHLRFNHLGTGLVLLKTEGDAANVLATDAQLLANQDNWYVREVTLNMKRVLKRLDLTAKTFFALIEEGSAFAGSLLEVALAADRQYMFEEDGNAIGLSGLNFGTFPMSNGLTRLETRFLGEPEHPAKLKDAIGESIDADDAMDLGLVTDAYDDIDWEDEMRLVIEERASMSPDALTGMEANLRFAGPETMETKIFGRLTAWQNWIFQRPNAVGPKGALTLYGRPETAEYDFNRT
ncbi:MAG: benzoyl-CoA-dihydrodiol lyase [Deltaproteobacteria bacterium]|nr:benzoyl-CoA-dihydrodiol lyase [Deltaproteobacteria bacterium]